MFGKKIEQAIDWAWITLWHWKPFLKINVKKTKRLLCGTDSPPSQSKNTISRALDML